jgi:hypothetical protein
MADNRKSKISHDINDARLSQNRPDEYRGDNRIDNDTRHTKLIIDDRVPLQPLNETFIQYYYQTLAGYSDGRTKINQDAYYVNTCYKMSVNCSIFGVFDGHGNFGHRVSDYLKKSLTCKLS